MQIIRNRELQIGKHVTCRGCKALDKILGTCAANIDIKKADYDPDKAPHYVPQNECAKPMTLEQFNLYMNKIEGIEDVKCTRPGSGPGNGGKS